jgi:DNA primase
MALFPQAFIDEVRLHADIVQVVQETVPLRKVGATYKGLCPFHAEKTPSFHVNRERGFFHCFGCGVGGDVFKFVELRDRVGFVEAARHLAERFGISVPKGPETLQEQTAQAERETLLKMHEVAAAWFREQLAGPAGARARASLEERGVTSETAQTLGLGFAPPGRDNLKSRLSRQGFELRDIIRAGLSVERDDGVIDRFRNRLMIPICRESGAAIAFGGRAMNPDQLPKYLNSSETAIYSKGRTLYGLNLSRSAIRETGRAVLVEGYFDFAQAWQAGARAVVASCGTALTPAQAHTLRRFAARVVLSYDADQAGQGAAARSSELLVSEGFDVNVAVLPDGEDPDTFIRRNGAEAYRQMIDRAEPYLEFLLDRSAAAHDLAKAEGRREFVHRMLAVAARIPDATARDQFADRIAHKARISEEVVRAEIRRAAVARKVTLPARVQPGSAGLKPAEKQLLSCLLHDPAEALGALSALEDDDLDGLAAGAILREARALSAERPERLPALLLSRLNDRDAALLTSLAALGRGASDPPAECARALRRLRYERERGDIQRELDRLMEQGGSGDDARAIDSLLQRKVELSVQIEALKA